MEYIIDEITSTTFKYKKVGTSKNSYIYKTENTEHYMLVFEDENMIQMYAHSKKHPNKGKLYDTGKIHVTEDTLKVMYATLILVPFRDEIYKPK